MTLKELWVKRRLTPTEVAGRARISIATLYKMNRKDSVSLGMVKRVCVVLGITTAQYEELEKEGAP